MMIYKGIYLQRNNTCLLLWKDVFNYSTHNLIVRSVMIMYLKDIGHGGQLAHKITHFNHRAFLILVLCIVNVLTWSFVCEIN